MDVDQFIDIQMKILRRESVEDLKAFGCLDKNCIDNSWKAEIISKIAEETLDANPFFNPFTRPNKSTIMLGLLDDEVKTCC